MIVQNKRTVGILVLVLLVGLGGCLSMATDDADQEPYDALPENTDFVVQIDAVGLADDGVTHDVVNDVGVEVFDEEDGFYEEALDEAIAEMNEEIDDEIDAADVEVEDLENVIVFGEGLSDLESFDPQTDPADADTAMDDLEIGVILEVDLTAEEIQAVFAELEEDSSADEELVETEYEGYTIISGADSDEGYATVLDDGLIVVTASDSHIEDVIDAYTGAADSMDASVLPDPDAEHTYASVAITDVQDVFEEVQEELAEIDEDDPMWDELDEDERELLEDVRDMPAPHDVSVTYATDGESELRVEWRFVFDTADAASEVERLFEEPSDDVDVDVTVDSTTVTVETSTTSDVVVDAVVAFFEDFDWLFGAADSDWEIDDPDGEGPDVDMGLPAEVDIDRIDDESVQITVVDLEDDYALQAHVYPVDWGSEEYEVQSADDVSVDWADADADGQQITITGLEEGDTVDVIALEDEEDFGVTVELYFVE